MNAMNCKYVAFTPPTVTTTSGWSSTDSGTPIDTAGANFAKVIVHLTAVASSTVNITIQEGDTTSSFSAITGLVWGTSLQFGGKGAASVAPTTDYNGVHVAALDLKGRKRYLLPVITATTSGLAVSVVAELSRLAISPTTNATYGTQEVLSVPYAT